MKKEIKSKRDLAIALQRDDELLEKALCEKDFYSFVKSAWHTIETVKFIPSKHLNVLCDILQQIAEKRLTGDVLVNMPPRHCKSLLFSVFYNAWVWITCPQEKFLCLSFDKALAEELGNKTRRIIQSEWYQKHWGSVFQLSQDQNAKHSYTNNKNGHRISMQVGGGVTGKGGGVVILDDPNAASATDKDLEEAIKFFTEKLQSRRNNPNDPFITIQQRLSLKDVSQFILDNQTEEYKTTHVCLPALYDSSNPNEYDWRENDGEPLWPQLYPIEAIKKLQRFMSEETISAQYQQQPISSKSGLFDTNKIQLIDDAPKNLRMVRSWDMASSAGKGDYTAGVLMGIDDNNAIYVLDVIREQLRSDDVAELIKQTAKLDGYGTTITIPIDPGAAGTAQVLYYVTKVLQGFDVVPIRPTGSKEVRANPIASQLRAGNLYVLNADWTKPYISELHSFPKGKFDDQVDSTSDAYSQLVQYEGSSITAKDINNLPQRMTGKHTNQDKATMHTSYLNRLPGRRR